MASEVPAMSHANQPIPTSLTCNYSTSYHVLSEAIPERVQD